MLPSKADSLVTFEEMETKFGAGTLSPYKILFDGRAANVDIGSEEAFDAYNLVLESLVGQVGTPTSSSFTGISTLGGEPVPIESYRLAMECVNFPSVPRCSDDDVKSLLLIASQFNSAIEPATYMNVILAVDPFSEEGTTWLTDSRTKIEDLQNADVLSGFDVWISDGAGVEWDAVQEVYDVFPFMIVCTLLVVFALMGFFFKSIVVPLRSVFSILLTLGFVFGLTVLVYQDGAFSFMNLDCVGKTGTISWLPPVMTFSIIVGLGLDYDVFLISRILEFREDGYDDDGSVLKGLYKTGGIITAAGIIMAVAFSGLLMSGELLLNQTAFILVAAVLIDTFVVRTILVPTMMGLVSKLIGTKYSWYPRQFKGDGRSIE